MAISIRRNEYIEGIKTGGDETRSLMCADEAAREPPEFSISCAHLVSGQFATYRKEGTTTEFCALTMR